MYEIIPGYPLPAAIVYVVAALIGLILGSFYTALASRIVYFFYGPGRKTGDGRWRGIFFEPSHCLSCGYRIRGLELTPLLGYLLTRGRCRNCERPIGLLTLLGESFPALLLPLLLASGMRPVGALFVVLLCGHLYVSLATDWEMFLLDHENALFLLLWSVAATWEKVERDPDRMLQHAFVCAIALLIFLALFFLSKMRGLGFGDVILGGILALYAGYPWSLVVFQLAAAGSLVYIFLIQRDRRAPAPLGAFFALAFFVTVVAESFWRIWLPDASTG
ncbi:MAG: prepilin peptidase [Leptospirales bacterium]|jgi:leader peptidase (prepilin peptidase)/N-methyltransferase